MLITVNARKQFRKVILWVALMIFLLALSTERLLQARSNAATARAEIINHWLQGDLNELTDPEIRAIWDNLRRKLVTLSERFTDPDKSSVEGSLIDTRDFPKKHSEYNDSASQWPKKDGSYLQINSAFGIFIDKQSPLPTTTPATKATQSTDNSSSPPAPTPHLQATQNTDKPNSPSINAPAMQSTQNTGKPNSPSATASDIRVTQISDDKRRYKEFIYDLQVLFQGRPSKQLSRSDFSDVMMDYFGIKDSIQQRLPNVAITLIYAASERETITIYPGSDITLSNRPLKDTPWYQSAFEPSKAAPEYVITENANFGLSRFYPDYASQEYTRTFWHKVQAKNGVTYLLCVDLTLDRQDLQTTRAVIDKIPFIGSYAGLGRDWLRAATVGVICGGVFLAFGLMLTHLGGQQSTKLARWIISGKPLPKQTESGDQFIPMFRAFADRDATIIDYDEHGTSQTKKKAFTAWLQMKVTKIEAELVNIDRKDTHVTATKVVELGTLDKDPYTRGLERWYIFRDKGSEVGKCRLCGQEVRYKDKELPIAQVTIKHGIDSRPMVKLDIDTRSHIKEIKGLEDRVVWQSLDMDPIEVKIVQDLDAPPRPRVPPKIQKMRFARELMLKYRLLNEGRYEVDDCIEISKELFNGRNVRAYCKAAYFEKLRGAGAEALKVLRIGDNVTRIFITDTKEAMGSFVKENRDELKELLEQKNQQLSVVSLEHLQIEKIKSYPELDFAIVYDDDFKCVVVSSLSEINKAAKVRGYVSWREADIEFYDTLFHSLKGWHPLNEDVLNSFGV
jgi:hypothetical protein